MEKRRIPGDEISAVKRPRLAEEFIGIPSSTPSPTLAASDYVETSRKYSSSRPGENGPSLNTTSKIVHHSILLSVAGLKRCGD
jgi:hypothetical protein